MLSRRKFIGRLCSAMTALHLNHEFQLDVFHSLSQLLNPEAKGSAFSPSKRVLEIGLRSGTPFINIGTGREFSTLASATYVNVPHAGGDLLNNGNSLFLNSNSSALLPYADHIAVTQGIASNDGHSALFAIRAGGGSDKSEVSPIIDLSRKNPTAASIQAIRFGGNLCSNQTGPYPDVTDTSISTFTKLFKKPDLVLTDQEIQLVIEASQQLSRQQSLHIERTMRRAQNQNGVQNGSLNLLTIEADSLLNISNLPSALIGNQGGTKYQDFGQQLAYICRSFQHNLVNSAQITLLTGDWHRIQSFGDRSEYSTQISNRLAEVIKFLMETPEPTSSTGETLWDTTTIIMTTEFTRGIDRPNKDNSDRGTQGFILIGKNIKGGYYGGFDMDENSKALPYGFDLTDGRPTPGYKNSAEQAYNTFQALLGNDYKRNLVMKSLVHGDVV